MIIVSIKRSIPTIEIRHKGLYDLDTLYKSLRAWLRAKEYDYNEKRYKDKVGSNGNELDLEMRGELRVNGFVQFNLEIDGKFFGIREFDAELGGEQRKVNNGQLFITLKGSVTYDYRGQFEGSSEKFLDLMINTLLKNYYDVKYEDRLYYEIYGLQTLIKEQIFMETASNAY